MIEQRLAITVAVPLVATKPSMVVTYEMGNTIRHVVAQCGLNQTKLISNEFELTNNDVLCTVHRQFAGLQCIVV